MTVKLTELRAVRIICDEVLKDRLLDQMTRLGAKGFTWWLAHGKGTHPTDTGFLSELRRICIEVWCAPEVAEKILEHCQSTQFRNIGMTVGVTPVSVPDEDAG